MSRATNPTLGSVPARVHPAWSAARVALGTDPEVLRPWPGQGSWVATTRDVVVYLAGGEPERTRVWLEALRLRWAASVGIPVPAVVEVDRRFRWLAVERVPDDPPEGRDYVRAALFAGRTVASAPPPPVDVVGAARPRRASRRSIPVRLARMVRSPLDVAEFRAVRRAALALPSVELAHGDFHPANVLFDRRSGRVRLIDFEFLGLAPRGTDPLMLWTALDRSEDRHAVIDAVLTGTSPEERERLAVLHRWLALRVLADLVTLPAAYRDRRAIDGAAARVREARANAERWTA